MTSKMREKVKSRNLQFIIMYMLNQHSIVFTDVMSHRGGDKGLSDVDEETLP